MKKRIKTLVFVSFAMLLFLGNVVAINAAASYSKVTSQTVIDSKYAFSPRVIPGVTKFEGFGGYSYEEDLWRSTTKNSSGQYGIDTYSSSVYYPIRLTSANKGKVGVWYRNIGEYHGEMLDLKITVLDWSEIRNPWTVNTTQGTKTGYPALMFNKGLIEINPTSYAIKNARYKFEFFDKKGTLKTVNMHWNMYDLDDGQYIKSTDVLKGYLSQDSWLTQSGDKLYAPLGKDSVPADKFAMTTVLFENKSSFIIEFAADQYNNDDFTDKKSTKTWHTIQMNNYSLAPIDTPEIFKKAPTDITKGEILDYNIAFTIPDQPTEYYYTQFEVKDTLSAGLKYAGFKVINDEGEDVSKNFAVSQNGQSVVISPTASYRNSASFYNKSYTITIQSKIDEEYDLSKLANAKGEVLLQNKASITAKPGNHNVATKQSNEVFTEVFFRINTSTDGNGTITESLSNIAGGSDKITSYNPNAGYKVNTITVDGKKVDISNYKERYSFLNIYDNHDIKVTFTPTTDNKIVVTKKIHKNDVNFIYGNPVAIFKCTGTDLNGVEHTYFKQVEITKDNLREDMYEGTATFNNLTAGNYVVTEIKTSRYAFKGIENISGAEVENEALHCDLVNNKKAQGSFVNGLENYFKFSHSDIFVNEFQ